MRPNVQVKQLRYLAQSLSLTNLQRRSLRVWLTIVHPWVLVCVRVHVHARRREMCGGPAVHARAQETCVQALVAVAKVFLVVCVIPTPARCDLHTTGMPASRAVSL